MHILEHRSAPHSDGRSGLYGSNINGTNKAHQNFSEVSEKHLQSQFITWSFSYASKKKLSAC